MFPLLLLTKSCLLNYTSGDIKCRCNHGTDRIAISCILCRTKMGYYFKRPCERTIELIEGFSSTVCGTYSGCVQKYDLSTKVSELRCEFTLETTSFRLQLARYFERGNFTKLLEEDKDHDTADEEIAFQYNHVHRDYFALLGRHLKYLEMTQRQFLDKFDDSRIGQEDVVISHPTAAQIQLDPTCASCYNIQKFDVEEETEEVGYLWLECWADFGMKTTSDPTNGWEMLQICAAVQEDNITPFRYPRETIHADDVKERN